MFRQRFILLRVTIKLLLIFKINNNKNETNKIDNKLFFIILKKSMLKYIKKARKNAKNLTLCY